MAVELFSDCYGMPSDGQAGSRSAAGIEHNPIDWAGIPPELLREDFG
jgi:hypothetical protein